MNDNWFSNGSVPDKRYTDTLTSIHPAIAIQYILRIMRTHYNDVIMSTMASQITSPTVVY